MSETKNVNVNIHNIAEHTLIFTEACPLDCIYCFNKASEDYMHGQEFDLAGMIEKIEKYISIDTTNNKRTQILFSGGEPFLYWDYIHTIMEKFGRTISYKFNTSGVLLTKEIIEYLSEYTVTFVLSCDGDETLSNYLRPFRRNKYGVGYMKEFRKVIPTLLYYFPSTPFRIIIGPRYIDKLHETYLFAERLGFKKFTFILDFNSRPYIENSILGRPWEDNDTVKLTVELRKICMEILEGWRQGIDRPQVVELNMLVGYYLRNEKFDPHAFPCHVLNGRSLSTIHHPNDCGCMSQYFNNYDDLEKELNKQFEETGGRCPLDGDCQAFAYCANNTCPKNGLDQHGKFFYTEALECALNKAVYNAVIPMLDIANQCCNNCFYYREWLQILKSGRY